MTVFKLINFTKHNNFFFKFDFFSKKKILIFTLKKNSIKFNFVTRKFKNEVFFLFSKEFNIIIFLYSIIYSFFKLDKNIILNYIIFYIKFKKIKIFISDLDNYIFLYLIKTKLKTVKVILIQNGKRGGKYDINFKKIKKDSNFLIDDFILLDESSFLFYKNHIRAKYHIYGNYSLNYVLDNIKIKKKLKNSNTIFFISQYRQKKIIGKKILFETFKILKKIALKKGYEFKVIFFYKYNSSQLSLEKNFYNKIGLKENDFLISKNYIETYENLLKAKIIVTFNSSLGYEMLTQKKKVFFISKNKNFINGDHNNFGYPLKFRQDGLFWINFFSKKEIEMKLQKLAKYKNINWNKYLKNYAKIAYQDKNFSIKINNIIKNYLD